MQAIPQSRQGILLTTARVFRAVPGVNRLGVVARAREETSLSGSGSTYRGKRTVASVPTGDLAQRKEKPHVRGSRAAETVAQDAARSDDEALLELGVATDCLVNPNDSAVGAARGFFSIIGGGGVLWTRKGVVRCQCGRLRGKAYGRLRREEFAGHEEYLVGFEGCVGPSRWTRVTYEQPVGVENEESVTT
ncbi:hypothetical protein TNCT_215061 [Trichonephila clavata]|uniref:Uncharacterized protein n=1 Tax=Trichonephila clavata TaxID=2740835 RepID=A0A8X6EWW9_TRICU|nr:hypothetical protein TNCT_215061 [Trichonephila clavata]